MRGAVPLPTDLRDQLQARLQHVASTALARELGVNVVTLLRAAGGAGVRAGTVALLRERLAPSPIAPAA